MKYHKGTGAHHSNHTNEYLYSSIPTHMWVHHTWKQPSKSLKFSMFIHDEPAKVGVLVFEVGLQFTFLQQSYHCTKVVWFG